MKKFETIRAPRYGMQPDGIDPEQKRLNQFGEQGYQLVAVTELHYYFIKQKEEEVLNDEISRNRIHYDYSVHD